MKTLNKFLSLLVIILLVAPMSLVPSVARAVTQTTIFSDSFEPPTGTGNWTEVGWNSSNNGHNPGGKSAYLVGADNAQTMQKTISTSGYENIEFSFWYKADDLDTSGHADKVKIFYTLDGSSWTEFPSSEIKNGDDDNIWHQFSYTLPSGANNNSNFGVKFDGDLNSGNDKVWVDDVSVVGEKINTPPVITLIGANPVHINQGDTYTDAGASANDAEDGDITANIVKGGSVDSNTPGTYTLTFDVTDSGGLSAPQVTRDVIVDPKQCNENVSTVIVSDTTTNVNGANPSVATWVHPGWAKITGATWIWSETEVSDPTVDHTNVFTKTFDISGVVTSANIEMATDNGYILKVNGTEVANKIDQENSYSPTVSYDVKSYLHSGSNTLEITVKNFALAGSDSHTNPAGLIYKLTVNSDECQTPPEPQTATIVATKIICDNESDLPNWGNGGPDITSTTADDYIAQHSSCRIVPWTFEWATNGTSNPGDNVGVAGGAWTSFSSNSNATIPAGALTWVREEANADYIPFSGDVNGNDGWDNTSAEMYCSNDVLNYDNYDWIDPVVAGQTYYCVAFNVLKNTPPPPPSTSTVKVCKLNDEQQPLAGWTMMLKGNLVQDDLSVPTNVSSGVDSVSLDSGKSYIAESTGTWLNQGGANPVDTEYSTTDNWTTHMDGYTGYQTDILELQINSAFDPNSDWGAYNSAHKYAQSFVPSVTGPANFRIFDGTGTTQNESWFGDNSGNLNVDIYNGYAGVTGQDGCVIFSDVPYGTYSVDEIMKDNWSNVSGLGQVTVNDPTEQFNVVNHDTTVPPAPVCDPNVDLIQNGSFENNVVSNPEKWNIFASGTAGLDWLVEWFGGSTTYQDATRPEPADIELHNGVNGWLPSVGSQYAELDSDWFGPTNPLNGEPASVAISQDTATIPGLHYELKFDFSPRPNTPDSENILGVSHNGVDFEASIGPMAGSANTDWHSYTLQFTATSTNTRITFKDLGTPNSVGTFLDNVSLKCVVPQDGNGDNPPEVVQTDVCPNMDGVQTVVPADRELKDGQCVLKETEQNGGEEEGGGQEQQPLVQAPTSGGGGGGNGPVNFGFVNGGGNGMVLGAFTSNEDLGDSCTPYLNTYMRMGKKNDPEEVKKLQTFLNEYLGLSIPVTGYFGNLTRNGVNQFQVQEGVEVLSPWVRAGLHNSDKEPTGYVYKTTQRRINLIKCTSLNIPVPNLP